MLHVFWAAGCSLGDLQTPERMSRGLVIVLPGIEGRSIWNVNLARGLDEGGVDCAIEIFDWGTQVPGGFLLNLTDDAMNRSEAARLRYRILEYKRRGRGRTVQLIGHSGGAGIAVMAAEQLPERVSVTSMTLLAAAISPEYDLRPALRHVDRHLVNCYSHQDNVLLGAGTMLLGNIDRVHAEGAGKVGFDLPEARTPEDRELLAKVRQIPWVPRMWTLGHDGGHFGWTDQRFVRTWLAPLIDGNLKPVLDEAGEVAVADNRISGP